MSELLNAHPLPIACVVEKCLPVGGLSLLVAQPKAGKSTFARNLMCSVSRGMEFFSRKTVRVPIVYLALEEPIEHVAGEFRLLGATNEQIYTRVGRIPKTSIAEILEKDIDEYQAGLAVVDPLFDAIHVEDANSYSHMNEALKDVLYLARKTGCHIMVLHHTNKRDMHGGMSVLGSQATAGATDHNLFLTMKRDGTRLFESQARVGEAFDLSVLGFDKATHRLWLEGDVHENKQDALSTALLDVLGDSTMTTTDWRSRVHGRNSEKAGAMKALELEGKVVRILDGRHTLWRKQAAAI